MRPINRTLLSIPLLLLFVAAAHADPVADIVSARQAFIDGGPVIVDTPEPQDLESYLLALPGNSSIVLVEQIEGTGNRAELRQEDGEADIAAVFQGFGDDNQAQITQTGAGNFVVLSQTGSNNQAPLEQLGNDNIARLTQVGSFNRAEVNQYNNGNVLDLQQTDLYNNALVNQYGGTVLDITQTNPGGSAAAVNDLSVSAVVEAGYASNFGPIQLNGPGQTAVNLCTGGAGFCTQP